MGRFSIGIIFLFLTWNLPAQNLVPNPGFEDYDKLPDYHGQIDRARFWTSTSRDFSATGIGLSKHGDFFHKDSPNPSMSIPYINEGGFTFQKYTKSGKGMGGIFSYRSDPTNRISYVQTSLSSELEEGKWYYIEFYILKRPDRRWYIYSDAIGAAFSDSLYIEEIDGVSALGLYPDIQNVYGLIRDTINWTLINGCYQAKGGESHLIIGNFKNTEETYVEKGISTSTAISIYYYIDDVAVIPMQRKSQELILCEETESIKLNAAYWNADYRWSTGHTDSVIVVDEPGVYSVDISLGDCFFTDTFIVYGVNDLTEPEFRDTSICDGVILNIERPFPGQATWSTGDTTDRIEVSQSGTYELEIENRCGVFAFSKYVEVKDCNCRIYVPNAFSPNGDGVNDYFEIFPHCDFEIRINSMEVYNRWGERVYYQTDPFVFPWDGSYRGQPLNPDSYTWRLEYEFLENSEWQMVSKMGVVGLVK